MSFILDALKKSEAERQRQAGPALLEMRVVRPRRSWPMWLFIAGGLLITVNIVLVAWLLLRAAPPAAPAAGAAPPAGTAPVAAATTPPPATPVAPASAPSAPGVAPPSDAETFDSNEAANPADFEPAQPAARNSSPASSRDTSSLQNYAELGTDLPPLRLDLHVYAPKPADRYAFINMRKIKEGDITSEGMRVLEITREGVVLSYRNSEFMLSRE
jgi:hypothetical protein